MNVMLQSWGCPQHRVCCFSARQQTLLRQHQRSWHPHSKPEARRRCECWTSSTSCWCLAGSPEQTFPAPGRPAAPHASCAFTPDNVFSLVTVAIMPLYTLMVGFPRCQLVSSLQIWQALIDEACLFPATPDQECLHADAAAARFPSYLPGRRRPLPCPTGSLDPLRHLDRHLFSVSKQLWLP